MLWIKNLFLNKSKNKSRILYKTLFTAIVLSVIFFFYKNQVLSPRFVDEEDNIALGSYLLKGEKLYSDLFSHHQPLGYIVSAGLQKLTEPNSIYLLIRNHRLATLGHSLVWNIFLISSFGLPALIFVLIFEPIKNLLLGHLFLSESLVIYPLIYLASLLIFNQKPTKNQWLLIGFSASFIALTLMPLWPALIFLLAFLIVREKKKTIALKYLIWGGLPLLLLCLLFTDINNYLINTFYINLRFYIPQDYSVMGPANLAKAFFAPLISFARFSNIGTSLQIVRILTIALLINLLFFIKTKRCKKAFLLVVLLGLANIRYISPNKELYQGFHLLPWLALFIYTVVAITINNLKKHKKIARIILGFLLGFALLISLNHLVKGLIDRHDLNNDLYVNYSEDFSLGKAIEIMASNKERLFVAPDGWLIYWQANIDHASVMLNYYDWMTRVAPLKSYVKEAFEIELPTYLKLKDPAVVGLEKYLYNYQELEKENRKTGLYVLKIKLNSLDPQQKSALEYYGFAIDY